MSSTLDRVIKGMLLLQLTARLIDTEHNISNLCQLSFLLPSIALDAAAVACIASH